MIRVSGSPDFFQRMVLGRLAAGILILVASGACSRSGKTFSTAVPIETTAEANKPGAVARLITTGESAVSTSEISAEHGETEGWLQELQQHVIECQRLNLEADRAQVVTKIGRLSNRPALAPHVSAALGFLFLHEPTVRVKLDILDELANLKHPSAVSVLMKGLDPDQPVEIRRATILRLEFTGDKKALSALYPLRSDPDPRVRKLSEAAFEDLESL
jgi:hypothetical protein